MTAKHLAKQGSAYLPLKDLSVSGGRWPEAEKHVKQDTVNNMLPLHMLL
jgi:hypothetical protein